LEESPRGLPERTIISPALSEKAQPAYAFEGLAAFRERFPSMESASALMAIAQRAAAIVGNLEVAFAELLASLGAGRAPIDDLIEIGNRLPERVRGCFDSSVTESNSLQSYFEQRDTM
jgi:hypothetical protein